MRKLNFALAVVAVAIMFSGCTLTKMIKLATDQDVQVRPNPLEVHGGNIPFEVGAILPPKMLPTGKIYTINTIYTYGDQEVAVGSIEFKGEDFPNSSSSESRQSVALSFPYKDGMNPGVLFVEGEASDPRSGKSRKSPRLQIATGLVVTSSFAKPVAISSYSDHGYSDKEELIPTNVNFYFEKGVSKLNYSLKYDGVSNKDKSSDLSAFIAEKNVTRTVTITGTHSPEGSERINSKLSEERANAIEDFYRKQMKKYDYMGMADSIKFILKPVVEDWKTLKGALRTYEGINQDQKEEILRIVNGNGSFEEKEKELQKLGSYDKLLKEVYPGLRKAQTEILTVKPKKSSAEISVLAKMIVNGEAPVDTLETAELLFAATLTPSISEKAAIYKVATKSGEWAAHNNLGAALLDLAKKSEGADQKKLIQEAITQIEIAKNKNASSDVISNLAAAYVLQGEYNKSYDAIIEAMSASPSNDVASNLNAMKGAIEVMRGEYDNASTAFASAAKSESVSFDKGLGELLSGKYEDASNTLSEITGSEKYGAEASYLIAIAAARMSEPTKLTNSLKDAVTKDPALKERALNDLEFAKYADQVAKAVR